MSELAEAMDASQRERPADGPVLVWTLLGQDQPLGLLDRVGGVEGGELAAPQHSGEPEVQQPLGQST